MPNYLSPTTSNLKLDELRIKLLEALFEKGFFYCELNGDQRNCTNFFAELLKSLSIRFANDASRRGKHPSGLPSSSTVDMDFPAVDFHSENSFSPATPDLVCFYCFNIDDQLNGKGLTSLVDGNKVLHSLSMKDREILQSNQITYQLSLAVNRKLKGSGRRKWFYESPGVQNAYINYEENTFEMTYSTYGIRKSPFSRLYSLANHLIIDLKTEPQIVSRSIPVLNPQNFHKIKSTLSETCNEHSDFINWSPNQFVVIDNNRIMHGRTSYDMKLKRDISNTQILISKTI